MSSEFNKGPSTEVTVDMSSTAIAQRLREVSELHQLGLSLARATLITNESQAVDTGELQDAPPTPSDVE